MTSTMRGTDLIRYPWRAMWGHGARAALIVAATSIGVVAVIVLTALGSGARDYVENQFASLGTNLVVVLPGRTETTGGAPPFLAETPRDLTIEDALAFTRSNLVARVAPVNVGNASVARGRIEREVTVIGTTAEYAEIRHLDLKQGRFLSRADPRDASPLCVIGDKVRSELFGNAPALGAWLRIGDRRYRVTGVLASGGQSLGVDLDDLVIVPVASAQALFDTRSLFRVLIKVRQRDQMARAVDAVKAIVRQRHDGEDDVTVITQDALLGAFTDIIDALTLALGGIAAISLIVSSVLIMNVMLVSVSQRNREIGLLKALGATTALVRRLFVVEAALLALPGIAAGIAVAAALLWISTRLFPAFPMVPPLWAVVAVALSAITAAVLFSWLPARRAALLDPVQALSRR